MTLLTEILKPEEYQDIKKQMIFGDLDNCQVRNITVWQLAKMGLIFYKYSDNPTVIDLSMDLVTYSRQSIGVCLGINAQSSN